MSHYQRTTRECTLANLRPELAQAIRAHAQRLQWVNWEAEVVACCETTTERIDTNRLIDWLDADTPKITHLAVIATSQRLIWVLSAESATNINAASALYKEMRLKISRHKRTQELILDIYARMDGTREKAGGKLLLDAGPDAQKFCEGIMRATDPLVEPEKPRRKWFGK